MTHARKERKEILLIWKDDPRYKASIENEEKDAVLDTDAKWTAYLLSFANPHFSDPDRYVPIFLKQFAGSQLSAATEKANGTADLAAALDQPNEHGAIQEKLLSMNGIVDWIYPYQVAQRMHDGVKNSELSLYANVGNFSYIEEPDRFFQEVTAFFGN